MRAARVSLLTASSPPLRRRGVITLIRRRAGAPLAMGALSLSRAMMASPPSFGTPRFTLPFIGKMSRSLSPRRVATAYYISSRRHADTRRRPEYFRDADAGHATSRPRAHAPPKLPPHAHLLQDTACASAPPLSRWRCRFSPLLMMALSRRHDSTRWDFSTAIASCAASSRSRRAAAGHGRFCRRRRRHSQTSPPRYLSVIAADAPADSHVIRAALLPASTAAALFR